MQEFSVSRHDVCSVDYVISLFVDAWFYFPRVQYCKIYVLACEKEWQVLNCGPGFTTAEPDKSPEVLSDGMWAIVMNIAIFVILVAPACLMTRDTQHTQLPFLYFCALILLL